jgi:hypothetical protein
MFGVGGDLLATRALHESDSIRDHPVHRELALMDQMIVSLILENSELVHASRVSGDAPIA